MIIERVIAGDSNSEIRKKLMDAGHPADMTDQAFTVYRSNKEVVAAIERKDTEAIQSGYAQRSERILKLARTAKRLEKKLAADNETNEFTIQDEYRLGAVLKEYRDTLHAIGQLVDPKKPQAMDVKLEGQVKVTSDALETAGKELSEWRKQLTEDLSNLLNAPPT